MINSTLLTFKPKPVKRRRDPDAAGTGQIIQINETGQVREYKY